MTRLLLVLSVLALATSPTAAARACSRIPDCLRPGGALPSDGAIDVPLNVELEVLRASSSGGPPLALVLRVAETDEELALVPGRTPGRMRAAALLAPSTRYELLAPPQIPSDASDTCDGELEVHATFTTGTSIDDVPPAAPTAMGGGCSVEVCTDGGCCGPYVAALSSATWSSTDDGALPVAYAFGAPDGPRTFADGGSAARLVTGGFIGGGAIASRGGTVAGGSPVFAIDAAGNVSATGAAFELDFSCAPSPEEAARRLECDGGVCEPSESTSGCAVGTAPSARAPFAFVVGMVAASTFARRRARR